METAKIGMIAAKFMDILDEEFGDLSDSEIESAELGEIVVIGEVHCKGEQGEKIVTVTTASTTDNRVHQLGICEWGVDLIRDVGVDFDDEDDDDDD